MRLHAILLVTVAALHARAASIPEPNSEKKLLDILPENVDKTPEISSSEQEILDQANTIKDIDNQLRTKPEVIPVEVIVGITQNTLKTAENVEESEEIVRPSPDLRNPGPPQRQEHETQNPEYYVAEQETILNFKKSVSDAQIFLKQGLQGITDGIQKVLENNEPLQTLQESIKSLRDGFTDQLSKINGTVQNYLNSENTIVDKQTKANFHQIEKGLFTFRNEFNNRVKTLADGVDEVAAQKAENEKPGETNPTAPTQTPAATPAPPQNAFVEYFQNVQHAFGNITQLFTNFTQGQQWNFQNPFAPPTTALPSGVQSDTPVTSAQAGSNNFFQNLQNQWTNFFNPTQVSNQNINVIPSTGSLGSGPGPWAQSAWQSATQGIGNLFQFRPITGAPQPSPTPATARPSSSEQPSTVAVGTQADAVTPAGPIRQLLLNNPISQGIAGAIQKVQNVNNPEKPREVEKIEEQKSEVVEMQEEENALDRGHYRPGVGGTNYGVSDDTSDSSGSRLEETAAKPEEKVPEVEKPKEEEIKEHKTEQVADKTE